MRAALVLVVGSVTVGIFTSLIARNVGEVTSLIVLSLGTALVALSTIASLKLTIEYRKGE
jgi:hypothetical protein